MLTALLIWLGWQVIVGLLIQRAPVEFAIRVAPGSAQVLSRAAEAELVADRPDQARDLAVLALRTAPFDVRAMRVLGLATARTDEDAADEILTLAGNWSLRDDPSHAWLVNRRLRQGDYVGAFGHADALMRRREDLRPGLFRLFTVAAAQDPRAVPALASRLAARPNWRFDYLQSLRTAEGGPAVQAALALSLERGAGRLTDEELDTVFTDWARAGRLPGLAEMRRRLGRPAPATLHDGGFADPPAPRPFRWVLGMGPGLSTTLSERPDREGDQALFLETDGFSVNVAASQLLFLAPGPKRLTGESRFDAGGVDPLLEWTVTCVESGQVIARWRPDPGRDTAGWRREVINFSVPTTACTAQWLKLKTLRGQRRGAVVAWFDDLRIEGGAQVTD